MERFSSEKKRPIDTSVFFPPGITETFSFESISEKRVYRKNRPYTSGIPYIPIRAMKAFEPEKGGARSRRNRSDRCCCKMRASGWPPGGTDFFFIALRANPGAHGKSAHKSDHKAIQTGIRQPEEGAQNRSKQRCEAVRQLQSDEKARQDHEREKGRNHLLKPQVQPFQRKGQRPLGKQEDGQPEDRKKEQKTEFCDLFSHDFYRARRKYSILKSMKTTVFSCRRRQ